MVPDRYNSKVNWASFELLLISALAMAKVTQSEWEAISWFLSQVITVWFLGKGKVITIPRERPRMEMNKKLKINRRKWTISKAPRTKASLSAKLRRKTPSGNLQNHQRRDRFPKKTTIKGPLRSHRSLMEFEWNDWSHRWLFIKPATRVSAKWVDRSRTKESKKKRLRL